MHKRKILHIDMDYFYAQVEERDNPELKGKPVGVGGMRGGRGVLCTSNYLARKYGVRAATPTAQALKLCPALILIAPHFDKYKAVSDEIFDIYYKYSQKIQKLSLDEAYLDVTDCTLFDNNAIEIAKQIKKEIFVKTKLTASVGVSYNKLLAKIGSDLHKPDGIAILRSQNIQQNIAHFSIKKIWGVGKVTLKHMNSLGFYTFGDLQKKTKLDLINCFGDFGADLFHYCRGEDEREVKLNGERKSLSVETTFAVDMSCMQELKNSLHLLHDEFLSRLKKHDDRNIKNICVKIKYCDFSNYC